MYTVNRICPPHRTIFFTLSLDFCWGFTFFVGLSISKHFHVFVCSICLSPGSNCLGLTCSQRFPSSGPLLILCHVICLSHSVVIWVASLPHTPFTSLVSRTLATRTVMSSMRSWILQLWPRLPAQEALLKLALGTLSSMQPSSLAHTNACHCRPFPLRLWPQGTQTDALQPFVHPFSFTCIDSPLYGPHGSLSCFLLWSQPSFDFPLVAVQNICLKQTEMCNSLVQQKQNRLCET